MKPVTNVDRPFWGCTNYGRLKCRSKVELPRTWGRRVTMCGRWRQALSTSAYGTRGKAAEIE